MEFKNEGHKIINSKEKTIGFFYVLFLFLLCMGICSYLLFFSNNKYQTLKGKKNILEQIQRVYSFQEKQELQMDKIQEISERISKINPELKATYEKQELNLLIGEVRQEYENHKWDARYKIFDLIASFYEFQTVDKDRLWNIQQNIEKFKSDLERCRSNTENRRNKLSTP